MGLDEATVQAAIDDTAARLGVTRGGWTPFVPDQENRDGAAPFWRLDGDTLSYLAVERGKPVLERHTTSLDELLEWVFADVTQAMAIAQKLHHRRPGEDSRRQWFARWIELMTELSPAWGARTAAYVEQVLARSPYVDR